MEKGKFIPRSKPPCPLSDPANPHKLCRRSDPPLSICFACKGQQHVERKRYYYYCAEVVTFLLQKCMGCKTDFCSRKYLKCIECNSFLGLNYATLPSPAHYKHDKYPLTLCYGEEETSDLQYWCEICEGILDATEWFYTCNSCRVTPHVTCLLGNQVSMMKPNHIIKYLRDDKVEIARNSGHTRPVCDKCGCRCIDTLVFKWFDRTLCTWDCLWESQRYEELKREELTSND